MGLTPMVVILTIAAVVLMGIMAAEIGGNQK